MSESTSSKTRRPAADAASRSKLLIVEDEDAIRTQMKWALAQDYEVFLAEDRKSALEVLRRERPEIVTLDLGLPPRPREVEEGFLTLGDVLEEDPSLKVIVITGRGEKEHALRAIGAGAYDFLCKPIELPELKVILHRAVEVRRLEAENRQLERRLRAEPIGGEMLGASPEIQEIFAAIRKVASSDAPILVEGESGTGKELVARAIHRQSAVSDGPFIPINCGAIPENLLESELFGHEKGSFTGAHVQRKGRIEAAAGGTLFFDEIGELSLALQVKLLRFLQEQKIERVGGRERIAVVARVIAATNSDLKKAMVDGRFREDLYYRISVVTIEVPPLSKRAGDVALLAKAFLERYGAESKKRITGFDRAAIAALDAHSWPGNVRELENRVKRAVIMAEGRKITPADLDFGGPSTRLEGKGLREARGDFEREMIERTLRKNKGNITRTATELGVSRPTLYELMTRYGIKG